MKREEHQVVVTFNNGTLIVQGDGPFDIPIRRLDKNGNVKPGKRYHYRETKQDKAQLIAH